MSDKKKDVVEITETGDLGVILRFLAPVEALLQKFADYNLPTFSGTVLTGLGKRNLAYLQDAQAKIRSVLGPQLTLVSSEPSPKNPAPDVVVPLHKGEPLKVVPAPVEAPEMKIDVAWQAIQSPCPVCNEIASLGLTATAQAGEGKTTVKLLVCSECILQGPPKTEAAEVLPPAEPSSN